MSSEWGTYLLGDVVSFNTGKLDSNAAEFQGKFPFFTCSPNTLRINSYAFDTEAVILAGNNANGVFSTKYYSGKFNAYQRTYVIEPRNKEALSCRFMYFVVRHMVDHLQELSVGSATKFLTKTILNAIPVLLPPKREQDTIAATLSSLDDRIMLLRETNATLEAIAQALFKSWFVDFDPVRAKIEGCVPDGMDEATAALFPDGFEESGLGLVPRTWSVLAFRETIDVIGGGTPKTSVAEFWGGEIPWFSVVDAPSASDVFVVDTEKHITVAGLNGSSTKLLPTGTTIISARGTVGRLALTSRPMAMNQSCYGLRGKAGDDFFTYLSTARLVEQLKQRAHGSVFDTITQETFSGVSVCYPSLELILSFEDAVRPMFERVRENLIQARCLAELRDTLLPRLISGQLSLPEAAIEIEAIAA